MKKQQHLFFRWPGSLFWLLPLLASMFLFLKFDGIGSLWWFIVIPTLSAFVLIELFTSVWLGISILVTIFLYSSIGSSGVPVSIAIWEPTAWVNLREMRGLEMTEFEWFHWWPFKCLIAMLCLNMTIVTIRRIPLNILTVGVWAIHSGVIIMVLGCLVYFSQKIEGDVLVSRRIVVVEVADNESVSMVVSPQNTMSVGDTVFTITNINPNWELMSGEDTGKQAYAVTISVQSSGETFSRQLIAGYPQYTEDIVRTNDPEKPMARAKKVLGRALVDENLDMRLEFDTKDEFYVTQSGALYLRELSENGTPTTPWQERQIQNLPRFNDYITDRSDVWGTDGKVVDLHPISILVSPTSELDPLHQDVRVTGYLRYAFLDTQIITGGGTLFPVAWVTLRKGADTVQNAKLFAFDPTLNSADASLMTLRWLESEQEVTDLIASVEPSISATIGSELYDIELKQSEQYEPIGETGYAYRIKSIQNNLQIGEFVVSLAIVELQHGNESWERWIFDDATKNRDVVQGVEHNDAIFVDENITMEYNPGAAPITIVGGVEEGSYTLLTALSRGEQAKSNPLIVGEPVLLTEGVTLTLDRAESHTTTATLPTIIPPFQRDPNASNTYSMVQVEITTGNDSVAVWLPYKHYAFESETQAVRRYPFQPTEVQLPNGRRIEMMFSRERAPLPVPLALDTFEVDSHLGGFTGRTSSILNWRSIVRFLDGEGSNAAVSVNDPQSYGEYWFFQSQWDPPDEVSQGLNYTVLGVGNRHGVLQMLLGCCLTVSGLLWAFYVKPTIKRKRQQSAIEKAAA